MFRGWRSIGQVLVSSSVLALTSVLAAGQTSLMGEVYDGAYVCANHDGEFIFRQLRIHGDQLLLQPLNPGYPTLEIPGYQAIKGVVVQQAGTRRQARKHYP